MIIAELWDKLMVFTFMAAVILTVRKLVVETVENEYLYSDHNPVELVFRLK